jgi:hypothetical protein
MMEENEDDDFEYTAGMDIADSIAFFIICALVLLVVLQ